MSLRASGVLCGTTTTGTGTYTLAAAPLGPGGLDFDAWARSTGIGFGNNAAILVDYTVIEFTTAATSPTTQKQEESGVGTLTLGGSAGIANCTLARTTIAYTITGMDGASPARNAHPGTGISIVTAANVLIMMAPRAETIPSYHPYFDTSGDANWGVLPEGQQANATLTAVNANFPTSGSRDWYIPFRLATPMLCKRLSWRIQTFSSASGSPVVAARIYDWNTSGQPGKLLYDFTPSGSVAITATGNFSTGAAGNGFELCAGQDYWIDLNASGLTAGTVNFAGGASVLQNNSPAATRLGVSSGVPRSHGSTTSGTTGAAPDPATLTAYTLIAAVTAASPPLLGFSNA